VVVVADAETKLNTAVVVNVLTTVDANEFDKTWTVDPPTFVVVVPVAMPVSEVSKVTA